ncbi:MAG TPA: ATP-binding protein [Saprospiraceae bacterium]|nr:ATP-binding protein [Saprospiraceae bacterium]HMP22512.1 ATP-binding protein [Saprospiraceae bacterium]
MKMRAAEQVMLKLPSNPRNISVVESFVNRLIEQYKISPDLHCNILVSVTEAVNNAILHGNCADEAKNVLIQFKRFRNTLAVRISDEGCGFDPQTIPDPTAPENLTKCGGRGVFLMQQLSHSVKYHNNGSTVEMQFKIA